ncbi:hypothetical protein DTO280E4_8355 [Paecilomyces variotii]|nr:hypothetical protein DTO169E5_5317 [Paecilomyces variotii]KAJ9261116.1 hypothetical protein DTO207G8_266 [Paecilomyces variotii]KAJ9351020.1 hypothetical protein DTO027B9_6605 [Paecilomyces variotii]KAJ9351209.1 hypothetical protein DTO280E4_8355 [Paecilomyces variotii]KAJ9393012.1 hypothetical protein DTO063F5_149 [Paecilomyces variotii]
MLADAAAIPRGALRYRAEPYPHLMWTFPGLVIKHLLFRGVNRTETIKSHDGNHRSIPNQTSTTLFKSTERPNTDGEQCWRSLGLFRGKIGRISKTATSGKWLLSEVRGAVASSVADRCVDEKDSCTAWVELKNVPYITENIPFLCAAFDLLEFVQYLRGAIDALKAVKTMNCEIQTLQRLERCWNPESHSLPLSLT